MDMTPESELILDVRGVSKAFLIHERNLRLVAIQDVMLQVYRGRLTALVGSSGSGKSSLLKCVYRTYLPTSGTIWYRTANGEQIDLAAAGERTMVGLRQTEIGFVTQFLHCLPRQSTLDVVAQPLQESRVGRTESRATARDILRRVNLPDHLWSIPPATFSGGEQQRVNLARGLIRKPRLLLLDEPTASLDSDSVARVVRLLQDLKHEGVGMLAVFHDQRLVEQLADHVVELAVPIQQDS